MKIENITEGYIGNGMQSQETGMMCSDVLMKNDYLIVSRDGCGVLICAGNMLYFLPVPF